MQAARAFSASVFMAAALSAGLASSAAQAQFFDGYRDETPAPRAPMQIAPTRTALLGDFYAPQREDSGPTRALVADPTGQRAGAVTIDTRRRVLYYSLGEGRALRYGIGVGREGFEWSGRAHIGRKAAWPSWRPPSAMLKRRPDLPRFMEGGLDNPLGARALYLYSGGRDTLFRIHGTNEPWTIGEAVSSGCIRMLNDDVTDLYSRVRVGAPVRVL
jgi:lipoprotein-anchoring transpeptidase ErfK/SrfK